MKTQQKSITLVALLVLSAFGFVFMAAARVRIPFQTPEASMLIDDFSNPERMSALGTFWRGFTDRVMGGVSTGMSKIETIDGRLALHLTGDVSTKNNGGFIRPRHRKQDSVRQCCMGKTSGTTGSAAVYT